MGHLPFQIHSKSNHGGGGPLTACSLRFVCGHASKAASTLRRALANDNLVALAAEKKEYWTMRAVLVAMLWAQGWESRQMSLAALAASGGFCYWRLFPAALAASRRLSSGSGGFWRLFGGFRGFWWLWRVLHSVASAHLTNLPGLLLELKK